MVSGYFNQGYTAHMNLFVFTRQGFRRFVYQVWKASVSSTVILITQLVVFFGMTIGKFVSSARNKGRLTPRYELMNDFSPLIVAFVRDGTMFFLLYVFIPIMVLTSQHFKELQVRLSLQIRPFIAGWRSSVALLVSTIFNVVASGQLKELSIVWVWAGNLR